MDDEKKEARHAELEWLRGRLRELEDRLEHIQSSRTWRLWMGSIALRQRLRELPRELPGIVWRALTQTLAAVGRTLVGWVGGLGAWLYLLAATAWTLARAALRRPHRPEVNPIAEEPARRPRVLVVSPYPLVPAYQGGSTRILRLLERLAPSCDLFLFTFAQSSDDPAQRRALEPCFRKIVVHRREDSSPAPPWDLRPVSARNLASETVREKLADLVWSEGIDVVQLEFTELGQFADACAPARVVLVEHDLAFVTSFRRRSAGFHRRFRVDREHWFRFGDWMRLLRYELQVCAQAHQIHVMSERDGALLARFLPDGWRRLRVVPNGVEVPATWPGLAERDPGVLYVGSFGHSPNLDAVLYLAEEIWPRVRSRVPNAELTVVGSNPPTSVQSLDGRGGIRVAGTVPETAPYYRGHRLLAAPLRAGSGTRLKILEAFAHGLPVVTTALGAEGLGAKDDEHLLLAENAAAHAEAICRLLEDDALHQRLAQGARALVEARYGWETIARRALAGYSELAAEPRGAQAPAETAEELATPEGPLTARGEVEVSVIVPIVEGGARLEPCLEAIAGQAGAPAAEVICIEAGSSPGDVAILERFGVRRIRIDPETFDPGLVRDLGARLARGRVVVFLSPDAVPADRFWLHALCDPLLRPGPWGAVQGGIRAPETEVGEVAGFSTLNCALRREVWERLPFGRAPTAADEKWRRRAEHAGVEIARGARAVVEVSESPVPA